jgi:hypothetical protein
VPGEPPKPEQRSRADQVEELRRRAERSRMY